MNAVVCPEEGASASDCWSSHESNGLPDLSSSSSDRSAAHADYESEETLACDFEVPASMSTSPQSGAPIRHACTKTEAPFGRLYSDVLDRMCAANGLNSYLPSRDDCVSIFYSTFRQPFTLESYVARIVHYTNCSRSVFVVALIYMDRIKRSDPRMAISELNVHRILMTAVVLSVKYLEDELYQNSQFAKIGGIPSVSEFNRLERFFLTSLDWTLHVTELEYRVYEHRLSSVFTHLRADRCLVKMVPKLA